MPTSAVSERESAARQPLSGNFRRGSRAALVRRGDTAFAKTSEPLAPAATSSTGDPAAGKKGIMAEASPRMWLWYGLLLGQA
jgi:hypothetical protein